MQKYVGINNPFFEVTPHYFTVHTIKMYVFLQESIRTH